MLKRPSYHFFNFTRREKNGTVFILVIIFLLIAAPFIYSLLSAGKKNSADEFKNEMDALKKTEADSSQKNYSQNDRHSNFRNYGDAGNKKDDPLPASLFYFDPNSLSTEGWKKLGLRDKTIITIQNYLSKGGKFREAADIKKIWGIREALATALMPYVRIEKMVTATAAAKNFPTYEKSPYSKKTTTPVDINQADSTGYISLPGIGPGFAKRIIKFRDKLGGFYKTEQVSETFGLPDSTFQKIKNYLQVSGENIRKINLNTASLDELKEHPYIRYQLANAIIQYRTQHGNFLAVEDIKKMMLVTEDIFIKLSPYLTVQ